MNMPVSCRWVIPRSMPLIYSFSSAIQTLFSSGVLDYTQPPISANGSIPGRGVTTSASESGGSGKVETIGPMFVLWGQVTGATTGITMIGAVLWILWERRANRLRMGAFHKQWPELAKRIDAFG